MKKVVETGWAIKGVFYDPTKKKPPYVKEGFYYGTHRGTKRQAIFWFLHDTGLRPKPTWKQCRKDGDRAVRIIIREE